MVDKRLIVSDLSPDQLKVYHSMMGWVENRSGSLLTTGGLAGTGKTTLLGVFAANTTLLCAYVTFTGRASSVLARKLRAAGAAMTDKMRPPDGLRLRGLRKDIFNLYDPKLTLQGGPSFVGTIHKLIYKPVIDNETEELLGWAKRDRLDRQYDLIVIDEASMVGSSMLEDLKVFGVPILAVGDHGQLPPVMDSGELMKNPDLRLETIHRQAEDSPIIRMAHHIRETGQLEVPGSFCGLTAVRWAKKAKASDVIAGVYAESLTTAGGEPLLDVGILCWTNRSRVQLNGMARKALGFSGPPKAGEVVIALRNKPPIYNGMRGILTGDGSVGAQRWLLDANVEFPDEGLPPQRLTMCAPQFCREKTFGSIEELKARGMPETFKGAGMLFDFGAAMTVHKSQGSQFSHCIFYVDHPVRPWDEGWRRLAYTAVTRAETRLTVIQ